MVSLVAGVLLVMGLSFLWPGVGGLPVHRLWWPWFPPAAGVASGDADSGVLLAMVCLMLLAWVI